MKKIIYLIAFLIVSGVAFAQEEESINGLEAKTGIYFTPQYLVQNGIRFDIEHQFKDKRSAIVVAPQVYLRSKDKYSGIYDYSELVGLGVWVDYKNYLTDRRLTYLSFGPNYLYNYSKYEDVWGWEDQGDEIVESQTDRTQVVHRIGMNATIGFNFEVLERVRVDLFGGFGLRYSMVDTDLTDVKMNEYFWEPAYTGTLLIGGLKVGLNL